VRWLLLKDLRILRRSPLLLALLVVYPVLVALLVGVGLSSGPAKPRVAFVNLVPPDADTIEVGGRRLDASGYAARLFDAVEPVRVRTRAEAIAAVRSGEVLGALVIPADAIDRLRSTLTLGAGAAPTVEVYYAAENPLKRRYVQSTIRATLGDANRALSTEVLREAVRYLDLVVAGGTLDLPLAGPVEILGLRRAQSIIEAVTSGLPEGAPERVALDQVARFARLAADNLDLSQPILGSIGTPVRVRERSLSGSETALDVFGAEVAVTLSLMVVALLIAAGMLALEREENAFGRLVRGLVTRTGLLVEKVGLAALCGWALATVMLVVLALFLDLRWARAPAWLAALAVAAAAFGALGVAIGALSREVRAASLLAFMVALPVAALALVPSGAVGATPYAVARVVSGLFPFKPALAALDAALGGGGGLALPLLHLAALALGFTVLARVALRRFG
jgi:ABC-2 type transport system permease protein